MVSASRPLAAMVLPVLVLLAGTARADAVDDYLEREREALGFPGLSLAVVRDGRVVKARGYGLASLELGVPATKESVYEIGSLTKQFTATAVMMLVEEGRIRLDDSLARFFPDGPGWWKEITLRHLLHHTSGILNYTDVGDFLALGRTDFTRERILELLYALPSEFAPGATWSYSNTGYYLLGMVIEKASGRSYWEFLEERIFGPLGMRSTRSADPRAIVPNRAAGYGKAKGGLENRAPLTPSAAGAAGAILSTAVDLARWDAALRGRKLVGASSLREMWTPSRVTGGGVAPVPYGFGWATSDHRGRRAVLHGGGTPGHSSVIYRALDEGLTVILLANLGDRLTEQLAVEVAGLYDPALARPRRPAAPPDERTAHTLRRALGQLLEGRPDLDAFTPAARIFLGTSAGKGIWQWIGSHGPLGSFEHSDWEDVPEGRLHRCRAILGKSAYRFSFLVDAEGRIAQAYWW
jgi:CubicO group peptidase (beta-lactamase class C family)